MWQKYIVITLLFFILALLQVGFLPHFNIQGTAPNLIFIFFFLCIFFQKERGYYHVHEKNSLYQELCRPEGFFTILLAGFLLDVFSHSYFGPAVFSLLMVYSITKTAVHFLTDQQDAYVIVYYLITFLACLFVYHFFIDLFLRGPVLPLDINRLTLVGGLYNVAVAAVGFYIYKKINDFYNGRRQLKLF